MYIFSVKHKKSLQSLSIFLLLYKKSQFIILWDVERESDILWSAEEVEFSFTTAFWRSCFSDGFSSRGWDEESTVTDCGVDSTLVASSSAMSETFELDGR